ESGDLLEVEGLVGGLHAGRSPCGKGVVVYQRGRSRRPKMAAPAVGDKPAKCCAAGASTDSAAAAEKVVEKRRPARAKWPFLLVLEHFEQHLVQSAQVLDAERVGSCCGALVEDCPDAAPRRFPQSPEAYR